jgi:ketosteroid isomerase-like protein
MSDTDQLAIRNLIAKLAHLADDGELSEYIQCFTDDARWGGGGQPWREGHAEILAGAEERRASGLVGPGSTSRHVVTTSWIEVDGDTASGRSVFHFYIGLDGEPKLAAMGVYRDTFRREGGEWRLSERSMQGQANAIKQDD